MSYRRGYYKKDGTYVQGHFVNKGLKNKKSSNDVKSGCLGSLVLLITTVVVSCTGESTCISRNCSDFSTQVEAQLIFDSDTECYSNLDRDNDKIAYEN